MSLKSDLSFGVKMTEAIEAQLIRQMTREYKEALKEIKLLIGKSYEKLDMTYQEMNKYGRLVSLQKEIDAHLTNLANNLGGVYRDNLGEIYTQMYYSTGFAMEKELQAKLSFTQISDKVIKASVQNPISGLTLNERLQAQRRDVIIRIKGSITQGLIRGDSYGKMAGKISEGLDMEYNKAIRIARTEAHRCQQIGRRDSLDHAEEQGVKGYYVWNSALDGKTRDSHRRMDGQKADKDGYFTFPSGVRTLGPGLSGDPAEDINCRCDLIFQIEGFEPSVRRVRGEGVIPYKTYDEWKKNRLNG